MSLDKAIKLSSGTSLPLIGLGTWDSKPGEVEQAVEIAVKHGYTHIDLALVYGNQTEVGAALKKVIPSVVQREQLFLTSKLWNNAHRPDLVEIQLDQTLQQLGLDYLDLYLMHWPVAFKPGPDLFPRHPEKPNEVALDLETSLVDTWNAMIKLRDTGKVRNIGVSNFTVEHISGIIKATGVAPAVNQVEAHPLLLQEDHLVPYCTEHGIHLTAYSPLGNNVFGKPNLTEHPVVRAVAERLGASAAQVLIAWGIYRGFSVIPKSSQKERIISNFNRIELTPQDYEEICSIGRKEPTRHNIPFKYQPKWDINVFGEPVERDAKYHVKIE